MLIGELAERADVSVDTIRYYEREGLIEPVSVRDSGYREFDKNSVETIRFVVRAKDLGFSLKEIHNLLTLKNNPDTKCGAVKTLAERKLVDVTDKIKSLQAMKKELESLVSLCIGNGTGLESCSILKTLDGKDRDE